jgi:hypothetical protein
MFREPQHDLKQIRCHIEFIEISIQIDYHLSIQVIPELTLTTTIQK